MLFTLNALVLAFAAATLAAATPIADNHGRDHINNKESHSSIDFENITVQQAVDQCSGQKLSCCNAKEKSSEDSKGLLLLEEVLSFEDLAGGQCAEIDVAVLLDDVLQDVCNQTPACCSGDVEAEFSLVQVGCLPLNGLA
ncbi:hypothetical protein EDC01DRAFT_785606 [Geopyxis carbonaria]|nr:hypothetical protein EDC01DRAFT_785606 [Geopyxis carbonaria]